jgi:hypothetical protein
MMALGFAEIDPPSNSRDFEDLPRIHWVSQITGCGRGFWSLGCSYGTGFRGEVTCSAVKRDLRCSRFWSGESIQEHQSTTALNRRMASHSKQNSCGPQNSTDFNNGLNPVRDQVPYPEILVVPCGRLLKPVEQ